MCTLHTYGTSGFAEKLNVQDCENSTGNSVRSMNWMSKFAKKLNIPNSENSTGNGVHYLCTACLDLQKKFKVQKSRYSIWNCVQYMYGMFGFAEKLQIQNCENSTENCVHYISTKCLDLQKIWLSRIA